MLRRVALSVARRPWIRRRVLTTPGLRDIAWRFVAGEDLSAGILVARSLGARGIKASLNFVGWHVTDRQQAMHATDLIVESLRRISAERIDSHVSIKLTQIGLDIDEQLCRSQLIRILDCAAETGVFVRVDMEELRYLASTLTLMTEVLDRYGTNTVGAVLQSYVKARDARYETLIRKGMQVRVVKGCYRESRDAVFRHKSAVDAAFGRDIEYVLRHATHPAIATHDVHAIRHALRIRDQLGLKKDAFEFQMLYGVRPELQERLVNAGFQVRCYVPYGIQWYGYVVDNVRRLVAGNLYRLSRRVRRRRSLA